MTELVRFPTSPTSWQEALSDLITDPQELFSLLELDTLRLSAAQAATNLFPLRVPRRYLSRIRKGDFEDPLLKQILPLGLELAPVSGFVSDPLQEAAANPVPGLLHKYQGRVLVTLTSACAVHCRYCFRRHFPYADNNPGTAGWEKIVDYLAKDATIHEIILSGGDPLSVNDKLLERFTSMLASLTHIKRIRMHTRLLIVMPERVTDALLDWIRKLPFPLVIVLHANHPNEINDEVKQSLAILRATGVHLLNQSVLLKGINDDVNTLKRLSETLFDAGVLPYYLHVLDKVAGAAHFDVDEVHAKTLHKELNHCLPGYLVPRLVREIAGQPSKALLAD